VKVCGRKRDGTCPNYSMTGDMQWHNRDSQGAVTAPMVTVGLGEEAFHISILPTTGVGAPRRAEIGTICLSIRFSGEP